MNLEESNEFAKHQKSKNKKRNAILGMIIICIVAVIFLIIAISFLKVKDANTPKLYLNGDKIKLSKTLFVSQDETNYVSVKEFASITGYNYIQGEYKSFAKDNNNCYLKSDYEVISFSVDNNKIKKYLINNKAAEVKFSVKSENDSMEIFELSNNVISINDNIYMPMENLEKIFNISINVDGKSIYVYDIYYLYQRAFNIVKQLKYPEISSTFENVRAISDGMIVCKNSTGNYGVISGDGKRILDFIYKEIQYIQNTEEFFVYTDENTVGLLDKNGKKIIAPTEYDTLTVFDETNKLYLACKDGKYGVLQVAKNNKSESVKEIVTVAFDKVGIKSIELFEKYKIKENESPNLLENKFIVVQEDGKYGLYDLDGNRIIRTIYTSLGFLPNENDKKDSLNSVLVIPKEYGISGLVVEQDGLYGIFDLEILELVVPCSLNKVYSKTESGDFSYYIQVGEEIYDVKDYFADYDNGVEEESFEEQEDSEVSDEMIEDDNENIEENNSNEDEEEIDEDDISNEAEEQIDEESNDEADASDEMEEPTEEQIDEEEISNEDEEREEQETEEEISDAESQQEDEVE
ncbi:MAG: WG repeat-containing protein [Clostridia bacterium]|nr:WG repeat-containing protein [Clostridia bacterium]